ncbi:MAG: DUF4190 domain-containing protein [Clostridia bacterium]|nr:DUF4190 domain-containing protein [Clostridia bacterium]
MICNKCGTHCDDSARFCTGCGADFSAPAENQNPSPVSNAYCVQPGLVNPEAGKEFALASLICGIVSFFCGLPLSVLAIIFGKLAQSKGCKDTAAKAGIICGIISLILLVVVIVLYIALIVGMMSFAMNMMEMEMQYSTVMCLFIP